MPDETNQEINKEAQKMLQQELIQIKNEANKNFNTSTETLKSSQGLSQQGLSGTIDFTSFEHLDTFKDQSESGKNTF